jgi:hypothetical protein
VTAMPLPHELDDRVDGGRQLEEIAPRLGVLVTQVPPADMGLAMPCAATRPSTPNQAQETP